MKPVDISLQPFTRSNKRQGENTKIATDIYPVYNR